MPLSREIGSGPAAWEVLPSRETGLGEAAQGGLPSRRAGSGAEAQGVPLSRETGSGPAAWEVLPSREGELDAVTQGGLPSREGESGAVVEGGVPLREVGVGAAARGVAVSDDAVVGGVVEDVPRPLLAPMPRPSMRVEFAGTTVPGVPLAPGQEGLWERNRTDPESGADTVCFAVRLGGRMQVEALQVAVVDVIERQETLRTAYPAVDGVGYQVVLPLDHVLADLIPQELAESELADWLTEFAGLTFDVTAEIPVRIAIAEFAPDDYVVAVVAHRIAADAASATPFLRDLAIAVLGRRNRAKPRWTSLTVQYADYTLWQRAVLGEQSDPQSGAAREIAYWREVLADIGDGLALPADRPRPAVVSGRRARYSFTVNADVRARLVRSAADATLFTVAHTAFAALLARLSGNADILVGAPAPGRTAHELDGAIGLFENLVALRTRVEPALSFADLLERVRVDDRNAFAHAELPFERLIEALDPGRSPGHPAWLRAALEVRGSDSSSLTLPGLSAVAVEFDGASTSFDASAPFDLALTLTPRADGAASGDLAAVFTYATDLFDEITIAGFAERLVRLLAEVADDPYRPIGDIDLIQPEERVRILRDWNNTRYPVEPGLLLDGYRDAVRDHPRSVAVSFADTELTYAQFDARVNQLARLLISRGVGPEAVVGLVIRPSVDLLVGMYAILAAGGAYVPVDPEHPAQRIAHILTIARPVCVVTTVADSVPVPRDTQVLRLDTMDLSGFDPSPVHPHELTRPLRPGNPAYVLFTSGATGLPKGVVVSHAAIDHQLEWMLAAYPLGRDDVYLQLTPATSDASLWGMFLPLRVGATLRLATAEGRVDSLYIAETIATHGITVTDFVPSALAVFAERTAPGICPALREVFVIGEALSAQTVAAMRRISGARVHNLYGPAETTVSVTYWPAVGADDANVPIGLPQWNTRVYVLDDRLRPVPVGVPGELYLAGPQLARGYVGMPAATAERFVADPYADGEDGARMYRTGDLVVWREGAGELPARLDHLGRTDFQVKIRGHRIELGEIESVLRAQATVQRAVVVVRDQQLVAYVTPEPGKAIAVDRLATTISESLSAEMIPSVIVPLRTLPLTAAGTVDRRALPDPGQVAETASVAENPAVEEPAKPGWTDPAGPVADTTQDSGPGTTEYQDSSRPTLADTAFGIRNPAPDSDASPDPEGGPVPSWESQPPEPLPPRDSPQARPELPSRRRAAVREAVDPDVRSEPTRSAMWTPPPPAGAASQARPQWSLQRDPEERQHRSEPMREQSPWDHPERLRADQEPEAEQQFRAVALSPAQERLWLLNQADPVAASQLPAAYHLPFVLRLTGSLDMDALGVALEDVVLRHEVLRTVYPEMPGEDANSLHTVPNVLPAFSLTPLLAQQIAVHDVADAVHELAAEPFELTVEPPLRVRLFEITDLAPGSRREYMLAVVVHHIAADSASLGPFARDLLVAYAARTGGRAPQWTPLPQQYSDHVHRQRELLGSDEDPDSLAAQQVKFWRRALSALPEVLELPLDRPRPAVASLAGARTSVHIDADTHAGLLAMAGASGATLLTAVHTGLAVYLGRITAAADIVVGTPAPGREAGEFDDVIGPFVNTVVLRTHLALGESFADLLVRQQRTHENAFAHADFPFARLVEVLDAQWTSSHHPLFQVGVALRTPPRLGAGLPGLTVEDLDVDLGVSRFDLDLSVSETYDAQGNPSGIQGYITYATDLFDAPRVERLAAGLTELLATVAADPAIPVGAIGIDGGVREPRLSNPLIDDRPEYPGHHEPDADDGYEDSFARSDRDEAAAWDAAPHQDSGHWEPAVEAATWDAPAPAAWELPVVSHEDSGSRESTATGHTGWVAPEVTDTRAADTDDAGLVDVRTLAAVLDDAAELAPHTVAIVADMPDDGGTTEFTLADLDARANRLARYLIALGVGPESLVALAMRRSVGLAVTVYAVAKAGGAAVSIDPYRPADRNREIIAAADPVCVLVDADYPFVESTGTDRDNEAPTQLLVPIGRPPVRRSHGQPAIVRVDRLDLDGVPDHRLTDAERIAPLEARHPAWVIFPAPGARVVVTHEGAIGQLDGSVTEFGLDAARRRLLRSVSAFDTELWEFWSALSGTPVPLAAEPARPRTLPELMASAVAANPAGPAVVFRGRSFTYAQLDVASSKLARRLIELGAGPETSVAVAIPRSLEALVTVWSVAKTGGAAVPIEPTLPTERIADRMSDSGAALGVTVRSALSGLPGPGDDWIVLDEPGFARQVDAQSGAPISDAERITSLRPDDGAYVLYGPGEVDHGQGAVVGHGVLADLALQAEHYRLQHDSRILALASPSSDESVLELLLALGSAAALVVVPAGLDSGPELSQLIRSERVTHAFAPSSVLRSVDRDALSQLDVIITDTADGAEQELEPGRDWGQQSDNVSDPAVAEQISPESPSWTEKRFSVEQESPSSEPSSSPEAPMPEDSMTPAERIIAEARDKASALADFDSATVLSTWQQGSGRGAQLPSRRPAPADTVSSDSYDSSDRRSPVSADPREIAAPSGRDPHLDDSAERARPEFGGRAPDSATADGSSGSGLGVVAEIPGALPLLPRAIRLLGNNSSGREYRAVALDVPEDCPAERVGTAVQAVLDCHPLLSARLVAVDGSLWTPTFAGSARDARLMPADTPPEALLRRFAPGQDAADAAVRALSAELDPAHGRHIVFGLVATDSTQAHSATLVAVANGLIVDDASWRILVDDLSTAWSGGHIGTDDENTPADAVRALAARAAEGSILDEIPWWQRTLAGVPDELQLDGVDLTVRGRVSLVITAEGADAVSTVATAYHADVEDVLLAALALAMAQRTRAAETIGSLVQLPADGRSLAGSDSGRVVGGFTAAYPLALGLDGVDVEDALTGGRAAGAVIAEVKERRRTVPTGGVGYGLLRYLAARDPGGDAPLSAMARGRTAFHYRNLRPARAYPDTPAADLFLDITIDATEEGLLARFDYASAVLDAEEVRELAGYWVRALGGLAEHGTRSDAGGFTPSDFPVTPLSQADLDRLRRLYPEMTDIRPQTPAQADLPDHGLPSTQFAMDLRGALDDRRLRLSAQAVLNRHEGLRVVLEEIGGVRRQILLESTDLSWRTVDFSDLDPETAVEEQDRYQDAERVAPFDEGAVPLLRMALLRSAPDSHRVLMTVHPLLLDERSLRLVMRDLLTAYVRGPRSDQLPVVYPYRSFLDWLATEDRHAASAFWNATLSGYHAPVLLADRGREITVATAGIEVGGIESVEITELAVRLGVAPHTVVQAAWGLLLGRIAGRGDVVFGVAVHGRPSTLPYSHALVGRFGGVVPVRVRPVETESVRELLLRLQAEQARRSDDRWPDLHGIRESLGLDRLFDSVVVFREDEADLAELAGVTNVVRVTAVESASAFGYPIMVEVDADGPLHIVLHYSSGAVSESVAGQLAYGLSALIRQIVDTPEISVAELDPRVGAAPTDLPAAR
ncbi:amino acid adenylation domain-containing protein [Nocardia alni]|uniref:amino acid adenylation domain-containing protein n=1 Tax=Nocardia alni TaxID=2815723 RepID=UPI0027E08A20|nr:amino acid adenylation domain-containing protein [Nocardia alni]